MPLRVLIVDDHKIMRDGLRSLIESETDMRVIAELEDGKSAVALAAKLSPDVVVMDVSMPSLNGIEATRRILEQRPGTKILGLSMHADKQYVGSMLAAGACGYLTKDCAFDELVRAIRATAEGQVYVSSKIAGDTILAYLQDLREPAPLSPREKEVLQLICDGKSSEGIADALGISLATAEKHTKRIMEQFGVDSVAKLIKCAIRDGLTSLEV